MHSAVVLAAICIEHSQLKVSLSKVGIEQDCSLEQALYTIDVEGTSVIFLIIIVFLAAFVAATSRQQGEGIEIIGSRILRRKIQKTLETGANFFAFYSGSS